MQDKLKIDIVSDVVCPWCIIGYKRLESAIQSLGLEDRVEIEWQPFELNPDMPAHGENLRAHSERKYGTTPKGSVEARQNLANLAAEEGLVFNYFDDMRMVNTFELHVLLEYAAEQGMQHDLMMQFFADFFTLQKDMSDRAVMADSLAAVGLDATEGLAQLDDAEAREQVVQHENHWKQMGISSVPTFVFNRRSALSGAQPKEVFEQVLSELMAEQS
ncbi:MULTISPECIES: DsbA family oxidoreductase [unclassified Cobetia]|uniref:DsbA family oxidoreductase n=1 Tax=unclassified Cobetia TaxID=2609414 RepID=UPI00178CDBBC|nr:MULTISPECIES: DsbA family oxidoreductase [unclassified Cobetia]MBE2170238.1 DsbA family oxidoreductase [Cobetia sp. 2AS1]MDH2446980.1 DsbA family oxidoreductase [Cobetia sp. 2AS]